MSSELIDRIKDNYLKKVECSIGRGCRHWIDYTGGLCGYPGSVKIGGKGGECLCFEPNYEYLREDLHEKIEKSHFLTKGDSE